MKAKHINEQERPARKKINLLGLMNTRLQYGLIVSLLLHSSHKDSMKMRHALPIARSCCSGKYSYIEASAHLGNISSHYSLIFSQAMGINRYGAFVLTFS